MSQPKTFDESQWGQSGTELLVLYVVTAIVGGYLFDLHWLVAMIVSPFLMLVPLIGLYLVVQAMWLTMLGLERIGAALGWRKSPLS